MDTERFDRLAKAFAAVGSRRWVIGGLLGGVLGLSRFGVAGANHKIGHHCTPSDNHPCPEGQTCREVSGEWTCQGTCLAPRAVCETDNECCQDEPSNCEAVKPGCGDPAARQCCRPSGSCTDDCDCCGSLIFCNENGVCDNDPGSD